MSADVSVSLCVPASYTLAPHSLDGSLLPDHAHLLLSFHSTAPPTRNILKLKMPLSVCLFLMDLLRGHSLTNVRLSNASSWLNQGKTAISSLPRSLPSSVSLLRSCSTLYPCMTQYRETKRAEEGSARERQHYCSTVVPRFEMMVSVSDY